MKALIVVDVEKTFTEGGSLAVTGGKKVALDIHHELLRDPADFVILTRDMHLQPGDHFASTNNKEPDYVNDWPDHGVYGTDECELESPIDGWATLHSVEHTVQEFWKGMTAAAYSGFEGLLVGYDDKYNPPVPVLLMCTLDKFLKANNVDVVDVVGIAYDYCVKATALDAVKYGYDTRVLKDYTASVNPDNDDAVTGELLNAGVEVV